MHSDQRALFDAYRATSYHVGAVRDRFTIRIGAPCPHLDALGATTWAFVTAYDPAPRRLSVPENVARQSALLGMVAAAGHAFLAGVGTSADGAWSEPSLLVVDVGRDEAVRLARAFGQAAIVYGERARAAELVEVSASSRRGPR